MKFQSIVAQLPALSELQLRILLAATKATLESKTKGSTGSTGFPGKSKGPGLDRPTDEIDRDGSGTKAKPCTEVKSKRSRSWSGSKRKKARRREPPAKSKFWNIPEYKDYREFSKKIRNLTKKYKTSSVSSLLFDHFEDLSSEEIKTLAGFDESRQCWFRAKSIDNASSRPEKNPEKETSKDPVGQSPRRFQTVAQMEEHAFLIGKRDWSKDETLSYDPAQGTISVGGKTLFDRAESNVSAFDCFAKGIQEDTDCNKRAVEFFNTFRNRQGGRSKRPRQSEA